MTVVLIIWAAMSLLGCGRFRGVTGSPYACKNIIAHALSRVKLRYLRSFIHPVVIFTAGGFSFAATQETHDSFCASCHTHPESTFYQRSVGAQAVDLASAHTLKDVRCIDCHSGVGVVGRIQAEMLGAHNALAFYGRDYAIQRAFIWYIRPSLPR
jgi:hypothetical protein